MISFLFLLLSHCSLAADIPLASFSLEQPDRSTLEALSPYFGLEHQSNGIYEVILPQNEIPLLLSLAPRAKLQEANLDEANQKTLREFQEGVFLLRDGYRNFEEVKALLRKWEITYPAMAKVVSYGTSAGGKELMALRLATATKMAKPRIILTAATHGDELITTEVLLRLTEELLSGYGTNSRLSNILDRNEIYIIPVVNPDGFSAVRRFEGNFDPNRSYPWPENEGNRPTPSIAAEMKFFESIRPAGSIDFHAYGELIMYPWAYTTAPVESSFREKFSALTGKMAATNNYTFGPISDVIYIAPGSSADYYFWKFQSISLGIEIGNTKIPSPASIPAQVDSQRESTWTFLESF